MSEGDYGGISGAVGCPDCGLVQRLPQTESGAEVLCRRCRAVLLQTRARAFEMGLALAATAAALSGPALLWPIFTVGVSGATREDLVSSGALALLNGGLWPLALMVFAFAVVLPLVWLALTSVVLICLNINLRPRWLGGLFRVCRTLDPWAMPEVFLVGGLVAYTRLRALAMVEVDAGGWCFAAFTLTIIALRAMLSPQQIWAAIMPSDGAAADAVVCRHCAMVVAATARAERCPRCGAHLGIEQLQGPVALVIAAYLLYIPANLLPVLTVFRFGRRDAATILAGVRELVQAQMWPLAAIVFTASIAVPLLKLVALSWFLTATKRGDPLRLVLRTRLHRVVGAIGRWSNIDVFMISILVALVQFGALTTIAAQPGAVAFGAVVVLTMLASHMFDPRMMWDAASVGQS
jgi:paraquat-inducible protein A